MGGKRKSRKSPKTRSDNNNNKNVQFVGDQQQHAPTSFNGKPFELLEIEELVAAVKKNPDLIPIARKMFVRKYESQTICIGDHKDYNKSEWKIAEKDGAIFLQAFGSIITGLWIDASTPYYKEIEQNIIKYSKSLAVLEIIGCRKSTLDAMTKPFTKLCILRIEKGYVRGKIGNFNTWFPNLRHLYLIQNKIANPKLIQHHMPALEHLTIEIGKTKKEFRATNVERFLHLNPELVSLQLHFGHEHQNYDPDDDFVMDFDKEDYDAEPILKVNSNLKKLSVHIKDSFCPRSIFAPNFHQLVEFELISSHEMDDIIGGIFKFVLTNVNLKKLKLKMDAEFDRMDIYEMMLKLTNKLKFLTEVEINVGYLHMHEVAHIIGKLKYLTKLRVRVQKDHRRTVFRKNLGEHWIIISPEKDDDDDFIGNFFANLFHPFEELTFQRKN